MNIPDISVTSMALAFLLLVIPIIISVYLRLGILKSVFISIFRMSAQLFLVGIFLTYLFEWNSTPINLLWFMVMVIFATYSVVRESKMNLKLFVVPTFSALALANGVILLYFNGVVINLSNLLDAKYLIAIGGMLLGNSLNWNIVGLGNFYQSIKRDESRYLYRLSVGANQFEALLPYFKNSITAALKPSIASMATMGIVFLPGLMTGQILSGLSPLIAIKYQIAIMIAIFTATTLSVSLTIFFTVKTSFDRCGIINNNIFKN
ncbi:putative ABC transport system permease protein [Desulfitispora alkaliphila]|uniref:ABC transporter permease n=1 Tax=Desulfitispora alkaliphila TaxID=622674 RepID=UPI003D1CF0BC